MSETFKSSQERTEAAQAVTDFVTLDDNGRAHVPSKSGSKSGNFLSDHELKMIEAHSEQLHEGYSARESENMLHNAVGDLQDPDKIRVSLYEQGYIDDDEVEDWTDDEIQEFIDDARMEVAVANDPLESASAEPEATEEKPVAGKRRAAGPAVTTESDYVGRHAEKNDPIYEELIAKYADKEAEGEYDAEAQAARMKERLEQSNEDRNVERLGPKPESQPISLEGLEPLEQLEKADSPFDEPAPARENESLEEYQARHERGESDDLIDRDGLEPLDPNASEEEEQQSRSKRFWARMRHPLAASSSSLGARIHTSQLERGSHESDDSRREKGNNRKAVFGLGALGVIAAGVGIWAANNYGIDFNGPKGGNGTLSGDLPRDIVDGGHLGRNGGGHGGNGLNLHDFDPSAWNVTRGEGWYSTFQQMGIPKEHWGDVLNDAGPKLGKLGEAYYDNGASEWRISRPGRLSEEAMKVIVSSARKDGVEF